MRISLHTFPDFSLNYLKEVIKTVDSPLFPFVFVEFDRLVAILNVTACKNFSGGKRQGREEVVKTGRL